jgi:uncharacterized DUF497 family protein
VRLFLTKHGIIEIYELALYKTFMQFEWDEAKNLENIRKHEIDFADVSEMFEGAMLVEPDDRFDYGEDRWFGIYRVSR